MIEQKETEGVGRFEAWLRTEAAQAYDDYRAAPDKVVPVEVIVERIRTKYRRKPLPE